MDLRGLKGYDDALKAFEANVSPRFRALTNLDAWANGQQYDGLPDWFVIDPNIPLFKRAPCIAYLLTKESIESKVDLVLGEGRFPEITTSPGEGDPLEEAEGDSASDQAALGKEDSQKLDAFIGRVLTQARYYAASREVLHHAQEVSSSVFLFGIRKKKLFCDTTKAQWCEPELDVDGTVLRLEIKYPYLEPFKDEYGTWQVRVKMFRRVIDAETDTTYKPADANPRGIEPSWVADPAQTFKHGFGFCPVVWYPFMRGCSTANQIDGNAPHQRILDEIRALDFSLSQRHRAALAAGDPQICEIGVQPGYNPSAPGKAVGMPATADGGPVSPSNPVTAHYQESQASMPARMKSPSIVWQYPNKDTRVEMLTLPPEALKAISDHAADLRMKVCEMLAHVPLDPDAISHIRQLSAKALESLRKRELNRCDRIRDDFGDIALIPCVQMLLRICALYASRPKDLNLAGLKKVAPILQRYVANDVTLRLVWGDYDDPDPQEEQLIVTTTALAKEKGLITDRMSMAKIQDVYAVENVDEAVKALEDEKQQRQADAMSQQATLEHAMGKLAKDDTGQTPAGGKPSKEASQGGSNGAAPRAA